ncbi:MAG: amidohydrolase family protein [Gemmataceae bacterium]|nr:amidohydrolase family protein [Gemmataceae bacterium]
MQRYPGNRAIEHRPHRREFLARALGGLTVVTSAFASTQPSGQQGIAAQHKEKPMIPVVDTHQHLWDLSRFKLAWLQPDTPAGKILGHNFTPKEYEEATRGLNVVKAVYMEVDVIPEQQQAEVDYIVELCASGKTPTCAAVVSGRPASERFSDYVRQFKDHKYVKGLRQVLHVPSTPAGYCLQPAFIRGIRLLGELGLSFDLCVRPAELPDFVKLIDECPGTRFILDHCGNADLKHTRPQREQWKKDMAEIAKRKHIVCKISGFLASAPKRGQWKLEDVAEIVNHTLEVFGPDRVMYGGDWPVCLLGVEKYADWLNALKEVVRDRPLEVQKKLFHDNAIKFYGLS